MIKIIMSTLYKMKHMLSHEHNRSKMRLLQHNHNSLVPNYANLVTKIIKLYMNCGIIAIVMGIILSIIDR